jgi:hypothetical protein
MAGPSNLEGCAMQDPMTAAGHAVLESRSGDLRERALSS